MSIEDDDDRLALLEATGAETFDVDDPADTLTGVFDTIHEQGVLGDTTVSLKRTQIECRQSDADRFGLTKGSVVTRIASGEIYRVRELEPDGVGMVVLVLGR